MAESCVVDSSPFIFLARVDLLHLLRLAGEPVVMTAGVAAEVRNVDPPDAAVAALDNLSWLRIVDDPPVPESIVRWGLGTGESSVLAWAPAQSGCEAILDDRAARRCAAAIGVPTRGTLALVLTAKIRRVIPLARPVIQQLVAAGMYLSNETIDAALALVDEGP